MSFTEAIRTCFRKYFTFSGRAARPEYWWFVLFLFLGNAITAILDGAFFGSTTTEAELADTTGPLAALFGLVTFIPSLAAGWRRMHDTGRSGLYVLYPVIVMIGTLMFVSLFGGVSGALLEGAFGFVLIVAAVAFLLSPFLVIWWLTRPSQPGPNEYGPHPRGLSPSAEAL